MFLTDNQLAVVAEAMRRHQTTATGDCECGRKKDEPLRSIAGPFRQHAHQADMVAYALYVDGEKHPIPRPQCCHA